MAWPPIPRRMLAGALAALRAALGQKEALPYTVSMLLHVVAMGGALAWCMTDNFAGGLVLDGGGGTGGDMIPSGAPGGSAGASVMYFQLPAPASGASESPAEVAPPTEPTQLAEVSSMTEQVEPAEVVAERAAPVTVQTPIVVRSAGPATTPEAAQPPPTARSAAAAAATTPEFDLPPQPAAIPRKSSGGSPGSSGLVTEVPSDATTGGGGSGVGTGTGPRTGAGGGAGGAGGSGDSLPHTGSGNRPPIYPA